MKDASIALVELFGHSEVLYNYNRIFRTAGYKVNNYTSVEIQEDAPEDLKQDRRLDWLAKPREQEVTAFIRQIHAQLEEHSLILFITLAEPLAFFSKLTFQTPSILVVHDYFAFFEGSRHFMLARDSFRTWAKDLLKVGRYFLRNEARLTRQAVANFTAWVVPSDSVYHFVKSQHDPLSARLCGSLDFALFEEALPPKATNEAISIVVPGIVSDKSRDYFLLLDAMTQLVDQFATEVHLTLLGTLRGRYGQQIKQGFDRLTTEKLKVITFDRYILQEEFDQTLRNADFLLLPIKRTMKYSIFAERNGLTCVSGNINDILRFGIPAILPAFYPLDDRLQPLVATYTDATDLHRLLKDWITQRVYLQKRTLATQCCSPFSEAALAQKFKAIIHPILHPSESL